MSGRVTESRTSRPRAGIFLVAVPKGRSRSVGLSAQPATARRIRFCAALKVILRGRTDYVGAHGPSPLALCLGSPFRAMPPLRGGAEPPVTAFEGTMMI